MKKKKKLLYVVEAMGGGVFTYIVELANELVEDYEVFVAYAIRPQTPSDLKSYFDARIHLIPVHNFVRSLNMIRDLKAFSEIRRIEKKVSPDVIHLHSSKAGVVGRWALDGRKVPMFYTPHGYSFLMSNQSFFKRKAYKLIEIVSAKRCCTTISCSKGEHQETIKFTKHATYVENGINVEELDKQLKGVEICSHPFTVFTLGRVCYQKNPELFNQVASAIPEVHFLWIGDGELREKLTAPNIEVTGWISRDIAIKKSANADVFLLTSLWEGLPISLLEAMYMKKLCVVSNVIGNNDVINNGKNGFVCNNLDEFISAIIKGKNMESTIMQETAFQDVLDNYNTKVMSEKYKSCYKGEYIVS